MDMNEYQEFTRTTAVYPKHSAVAYLGLGLAGEAGEVADKVKKVRALIANLDDTAALRAQVSENTGRRDLSYIERSLFAQELGTAEPVSAVRLEKALRDLAAGRTEPESAPPKAKPAVALPVKGKTVLKSLDALGNLPR